jgi:hypothetical protein
MLIFEYSVQRADGLLAMSVQPLRRERFQKK